MKSCLLVLLRSLPRTRGSFSQSRQRVRRRGAGVPSERTMTDSKRWWRGAGRESGGVLLRVVGKDGGSAVYNGAKASGGGAWGGERACGRRRRRAEGRGNLPLRPELPTIAESRVVCGTMSHVARNGDGKKVGSDSPRRKKSILRVAVSVVCWQQQIMSSVGRNHEARQRAGPDVQRNGPRLLDTRRRSSLAGLCNPTIARPLVSSTGIRIGARSVAFRHK